jgi:dihydroorotase-like cyclic amidohydrolase
MIIIKNAQIVNEDSVTTGDILIREGRIEKIASSI